MKYLIYTFCSFVLFAMSAYSQIELQNAFPALSFNRPVDLQHPGDGSNRLFVVEQAGRIFVFENQPAVANTVLYLDIRNRVNSSGNEEGLLGLAFHPSFATNGFFYVNYTASSPRRTVISRFQRSASDPNSADPSSEEVILEFAQPFSNHNGGQIAFGPDGFLYIATGDGGSGGDPQNNSQNRANLLGKILRIDVDTPSGGKQYGIPEDNPYKNNDAGFREEIWAYGLRNPWRFSFDPSTDRLWTADVGQNRFEEIDIVVKGGNYGWRIMEGFSCFNPASGCDTTGLIPPVHVYERTLGVSVTGGHVYRGSNVPTLQGQYLYADFVSGRLWGLTYDGPGKVKNTLLLETGQNISSFGVDQSKELYICTFSGAIFKFKPLVNAIQASRLPDNAALDIHPSPLRKSNSSPVTIQVAIPQNVDLRLTLHDTLGRRLMTIAEGNYTGGRHTYRIDGSTLHAGLYFVSLQLPDTRVVRKFLVLD
ncbi:MAG: PQQ-dependent sugar dehydrogenase [Bacteroidia bacterium]|nr:PQQ-dependent sugar dehydrogenase [Bacteroidia bacterium]